MFSKYNVDRWRLTKNIQKRYYVRGKLEEYELNRISDISRGFEILADIICKELEEDETLEIKSTIKPGLGAWCLSEEYDGISYNELTIAGS